MRATGLFTVGVGLSANQYSLPHPRLPLPVILVIRRVLLRAFAILSKQCPNLSAATEDQVTAALRNTIENDLRQSGDIPGFSKRTFETVIRQGQWENYEGVKLNKAPDIFFKLRDDEGGRRRALSAFDGLFVEAKPVDQKHSVKSKYCDDGLIRFVTGDYAWAMQEAMMLAYVRNGRTIAGHLVPAMDEAARKKSLCISKLPEICSGREAAACAEAEAVHFSRHARNFTWRDNKGKATEITIYHLWHQCSN